MNNWITATIISGVAIAGTVEAENRATAEKEVRKRIGEFRDAGDTRDTTLIDKVLHKNFRLIAYMAGDKDGFVMDKPGYSGALAAGKIGGIRRELTILSVEISGSRASVHIRMSSAALAFDNIMQWVKTEDGWQLVNDLAHAVPAQ